MKPQNLVVLSEDSIPQQRINLIIAERVAGITDVGVIEQSEFQSMSDKMADKVWLAFESIEARNNFSRKCYYAPYGLFIAHDGEEKNELVLEVSGGYATPRSAHASPKSAEDILKVLSNVVGNIEEIRSKIEKRSNLLKEAVAGFMYAQETFYVFSFEDRDYDLEDPRSISFYFSDINNAQKFKESMDSDPGLSSIGIGEGWLKKNYKEKYGNAELGLYTGVTYYIKEKNLQSGITVLDILDFVVKKFNPEAAKALEEKNDDISVSIQVAERSYHLENIIDYTKPPVEQEYIDKIIKECPAGIIDLAVFKPYGMDERVWLKFNNKEERTEFWEACYKEPYRLLYPVDSAGEAELVLGVFEGHRVGQINKRPKDGQFNNPKTIRDVLKVLANVVGKVNAFRSEVKKRSKFLPDAIPGLEFVKELFNDDCIYKNSYESYELDDPVSVYFDFRTVEDKEGFREIIESDSDLPSLVKMSENQVAPDFGICPPEGIVLDLTEDAKKSAKTALDILDVVLKKYNPEAAKVFDDKNESKSLLPNPNNMKLVMGEV